MEVKKYQRISEFFKDFIEEININASELAKKLDVSPQYISLIINEKKIPSSKLLNKLCEMYELNLEDFLSLRKRTIENRNIIPEKENTTDSSSVSDSNFQNTELKQNQFIFEEVNPQIQVLMEKINSLSDDIQQKIAEDINELIETHTLNAIQKYSFRDMKDILKKTIDTWMKLTNKPGYEKEEKEEFIEEFDGYLELSNSSLFFTLKINEKMLIFKTRYQDRHQVDDLLKIIPGVKVSQFSNGNLGKTYKNTSLNNVIIFNPVSLVKDMRDIFMELNFQINKIKFEECILEPYFK